MRKDKTSSDWPQVKQDFGGSDSLREFNVMNRFRFGGLVLLIAAMAGAVLLYQGQARRPGVMPAIIRIGVLPDENEAILRERYAPLVEFLSREVGVPFELVVPTDYPDLLALFGRGDVDLGFFGGLTFLLANDQYGAAPMVMRDVDVNFRSHFFARSDHISSGDSIADFKGKAFAFGSSLSTSGHLMPRFFLEQEGINAELFFDSVEYSGAHDKTGEWVRDSHVDFGVANSQVIDKMFTDGRLKSEDVKVVWTTPAYPDYVWAVRPEISLAVQDRILSTFLSIDPLTEEHKDILAGVGAAGFLPAILADFEELRAVAEGRGLL